MFQNIADTEISAADSAKFINSQIKAFNMTAKDSTKIIDKVNEVANKNAVGTNDLQLALTKAGSAMGTLGNSYEQTIGLVTAGTEIMVGQSSKVGRGLRTIGINIGNMAKSTDTWEAANGKLSVSLRDQNGDMRSTYDVMSDVAKQWDTLTKAEQNEVAVAAAGKNQYEVFTAIMGNFKTAVKATSDAQDSAGSAMRENAKYMDSIEGKVSSLKSAWSRLSNELINSDMIKGALSGLTGIVDLLASDFGQAAIKATALSLGVFAITKGSIALIPKAVSAGKAIKGFAESLAIANLIIKEDGFGSLVKSSSKLGKISKFLGSGAFAVGLPLALAGASVALAKYVDIGSSKEAKDTEEGFAKTKGKVDRLTKSIQKNRDEWKKLNEKAKTPEGLTDSEKNRLANLQRETEELKKQLELQKAIASRQAEKKWQSVDPDKLSQGQRQRYITAKQAGKSDKEALAAAGAYNRADVAASKYAETQASVATANQKASDAMKEYDKAVKDSGKNSEEAYKALDKWNVLQEDADKKTKDSKNALKDLTKQRDKLYKDFGGKELFEKNASDELKKSAKYMNNLIKTAEGIDKIQNKGADVTKTFRKLGKSVGLVRNEAKGINKLDVDKFQNSLKSAGVSAEDTLDYIKQLKKSDPDLQIKVKGKDVAVKDLEVIDGKIQKIPKSKTSNVKAKTSGQKGVDDLNKSIKNTKDKGVNVKASVTGKSLVDKLKSAIAGLKSKTISVTTKKKTVKEAHGTRHFASGIANDIIGGNAEVNEQGFEIIQSPNGAMRIANAGKRGATYIEEGSAVYTHGQSMRMLQKAGLTEADLLQGKEGDVGVFGVRKLEGFAKGLTQKQYNAKRDKLRDTYDSAISKAEYQQELYHYSDEWLTKQMTAARTTYLNNLKKLNKQKVRKGVSKSSGLSTEQERDYQLALADVAHESAVKAIESQTKELEFGRKTYKELTDLVKKYYNDKKISAEEYNEYIAELNEAEVERVRNNYENQWDYISQYIQRQIDLQEEDNSLLEAQSELLKAQSQKVKVYREGQGWVYAQNAEAVREAQQNLKEYSSVWEEIQAIMDDVEAQANLQRVGVLAGSDLVSTVLGAGTDINTWRNIIGLIGSNVGAYGLAGDLGITDPSKITKATTINGQTFNIDNIALPNVSNANDFVNELTKLANQAVQTSMMR